MVAESGADFQAWAAPWRASRQRSAEAGPGGWLGWLRAADHETIGRRFIATAFMFFLLGGQFALAMRLQLARPDHGLIGPDLYDQLFTMRGTTMMFLFGVPIMEAMALYMVPPMIGTSEIAFPRLAAFHYGIFLFGGLMLYAGFLLESGPGVG